MPIRVLVLGSSGFLGSNLALLLSDCRDFQIIGASRHPFQHGQLELADYAQESLSSLLDSVEPDVIINCVGIVGHLKVEENPDLSERLNVFLPRTLGRMARERGIHLVHFSSDAVYSGVPIEAPFDESSVPSPFSTYGRQKLDGERATLEADPDALIFRINFFGWSRCSNGGILDHFVSHALAGSRPIGFARYTVSSLATTTVARIVGKSLSNRLSGVYNLGSSDGMSKFAFGQAVFSHLGLDPDRVIAAVPTIWEFEGIQERDLTMSVKAIENQLGIIVPPQLSNLRDIFRVFPKFLKYFGSEVDDPRRSLSRGLSS